MHVLVIALVRHAWHLCLCGWSNRVGCAVCARLNDLACEIHPSTHPPTHPHITSQFFSLTISSLTLHRNLPAARERTMASTATHDPAEHLLRDIEPQMEILRRYIHEDTIWDGTAVYVSRQRPRRGVTCFGHM